MDQQTYDRMPASIQVRQVHVQVARPGFRPESFVVVTTLTDAAAYAQEDIAELYHHHWWRSWTSGRLRSRWAWTSYAARLPSRDFPFATSQAAIIPTSSPDFKRVRTF